MALSTRWKKPVTRVHVLEDGLAGVARLVAECGADRVILASASCLFLVDERALRDRIDEAGDRVVKLSVSRTPVEVFISSRSHLSGLLETAAERATGQERPP